MSTRFLQRQEIKVKTQDSRPRIHQAIYLRYRSFNSSSKGGVSELSYAQSEDRSQATKLPTQAEDRDRDRFKSRFKEHPVPKLGADLTSRRIAVVLGSHSSSRSVRLRQLGRNPSAAHAAEGRFRSALTGAHLRSHELAA